MTGQDMFDRMECTRSFFVHTYPCCYLTPYPEASYYHTKVRQKYFLIYFANLLGKNLQNLA